MLFSDYIKKRINILFALALILFVLVCPNICHADSMIPLINIFTPDTSILSSVLTFVIILVEAFLLWAWIEPVSFRLSLWRSALINVTSSAVGSVIALLFFRDKLQEWDILGWDLVIPMFILTLVVETPLLKILYRKLDNGFSWFRAIKISLGINFYSYLIIYIIQFLLFFVQI